MRGGQTDVKAELCRLAEPSYAAFASGLLRRPEEEAPTGSAAHLLGVRLPALRRLSRRMAKEDWRGHLESLGDTVFEELMLKGFMIGGLRADRTEGGLGEILDRVRSFVPKIDNWSVCDSFCSSLKLAKEYPEPVWKFLQPFLLSGREFEVRFGLVMLLNYYVSGEYLDRLFECFESVRHEGYYVRMALAWAVSVCFTKFPDRTMEYLNNNRLDAFTRQKTLQKITESHCVDDETKARIREMKREYTDARQRDTGACGYCSLSEQYPHDAVLMQK